MIIQPTSLAALTWAGAASGTSAESWRIGAVLSARPLGMGDQGRMVLQIGALTVETDALGTPLPSQFQVRVLSLGSQPQLEVLGAAAADPVLQRALRERLPQQNGYAPLLASLGALAQRPVVRQLPAHIRAALATLDQNVRTPDDLTRGDGLREAIEHSGSFLESRLADPQVDPTIAETDWKGALLKLAALLDERPLPAPRPAPAGADTPPPLRQRGLQAQPRAAPPPALSGDADAVGLAQLLGRLRGDVHAALARLEIAQLDATTGQAWMIEIPVRHADGGRDVVQLHLEYAPEAEGSGGTWALGFALDLPALGPVQGELHLRELRLSVRLWAERGSSVDRLERQFGALRHRLAASGLLLDQLTCHAGLPRGQGSAGALLLKTTA